MIDGNIRQLHPNRQAFTLIELLVVIAIIALLMGILMPSLSAARKQAMSSTCQSNLRQMAIGMNLYTLDHEDKTMPFSHDNGEYWFHQIAPYLSAKDFKNNPEQHQKSMRVAFCPVANKFENDTDSWGSAKRPWRFMGAEGSYGMNLWLLPTMKFTGYVQDHPERNFFKKYSQANGNVPLLGDCNWVGSWPYDVGTMPSDLSGETATSHTPPEAMKRFCLDRHKRAINVGFVDTRVDKVRIEDLWSLKWHKNFKPITEIEIQ